jgi:hypothetical protein
MLRYVLILLFAVPLAFAGGVLWYVADPTDHLDRIYRYVTAPRPSVHVISEVLEPDLTYYYTFRVVGQRSVELLDVKVAKGKSRAIPVVINEGWRERFRNYIFLLTHKYPASWKAPDV